VSLFENFFVVGVEAEYITKMFLETSLTVVQNKLGVHDCLDVYWTDPETDVGDLRMDIVICEEDAVLKSQKVEVKAAKKKPEWDSFFAEIVSLGSNGYAHYLVDKPAYIVYVDLIGKRLYFYDGKEFTHRVKNRQHSAFTNSYGTATGVKFRCDDEDYGYIFDVDIKQYFHYVRTKCNEEVKERAKTIQQETTTVPVYHKCDGFPDLV
jgi:hypothetical protein